MLAVKKHFLLLVSFFRASAIADLEYRLNFGLKIFTDLIWYCAQLSIFEVLFTHTNSLSGWTLASSRVFLCVLFLTDSLWMMLFSENLDRLSDKVRKGDLDLLLVKPVNAQFMMSFQRMSPSYLMNFCLVTIFLVWSLLRLPEPVPLARLFLLVLLVPSSLAISYSCRFFFAASAFIFQRAENINYVWFQIFRLGTRPDTLYPPWLRYIILTILPVGFLASVPTRLILHRPDWLLLAGAILMPIVGVLLSRRYWRFAIRRYASASS